MPEQETPWMPGHEYDRFTVILVNPHGTRHLGFDLQSGMWHRLWQHRSPEPLHTGEAVLLRPSDVDLIIKTSMSWSARNWGHQRAGILTDELAAGVKQLVLHYAASAGHYPQTSA